MQDVRFAGLVDLADMCGGGQGNSAGEILGTHPAILSPRSRDLQRKATLARKHLTFPFYSPIMKGGEGDGTHTATKATPRLRSRLHRIQRLQPQLRRDR